MYLVHRLSACVSESVCVSVFGECVGVETEEREKEVLKETEGRREKVNSLSDKIFLKTIPIFYRVLSMANNFPSNLMERRHTY